MNFKISVPKKVNTIVTATTDQPVTQAQIQQAVNTAMENANIPTPENVVQLDASGKIPLDKMPDGFALKQDQIGVIRWIDANGNSVQESTPGAIPEIGLLPSFIATLTGGSPVQTKLVTPAYTISKTDTTANITLTNVPAGASIVWTWNGAADSSTANALSKSGLTASTAYPFTIKYIQSGYTDSDVASGSVTTNAASGGGSDPNLLPGATYIDSLPIANFGTPPINAVNHQYMFPDGTDMKAGFTTELQPGQEIVLDMVTDGAGFRIAQSADLSQNPSADNTIFRDSANHLRYEDGGNMVDAGQLEAGSKIGFAFQNVQDNGLYKLIDVVVYDSTGRRVVFTYNNWQGWVGRCYPRLKDLANKTIQHLQIK